MPFLRIGRTIPPPVAGVESGMSDLVTANEGDIGADDAQAE
jgi:hypothetical protein